MGEISDQRTSPRTAADTKYTLLIPDISYL